MTRLDSILRNTLFSLVGRGIDVTVTFALAVILARYLGPEGMGEYTYIIAFVAIFVPFIDLGLDHILIREIARHRDAARKYVGAALLLKLLIILVLLPAGVVVTWLVGDVSVDARAIFLCFVGTLVLREIPTVVGYAVFLAYERMEYRALVTLLFQIVKLVFTLGVILSGEGLVAIFAAALLAEAFQGAAAIYVVVRKFTRPRLVFDPKLWKHYVKESLPIGIAFAFNNLYFQVDILVLKHFRTAEETGWFGVPFRVVSTLFSVLIPMIWVLLPHLTRAAKNSIEQLHEEGQGYLKAIFVITAGIALYLGFESRDLVSSLFGVEYLPSALVMTLISPVIIFHAFSYFFDLTLTAVGRQRLIVVGAGSIFLVKLVVDLIFVPRYGIMGAAMGTLASDVACFSVMFYLTRKHVTSFNFGSIMVKPTLAALAAAIILWFVKVWPFYLSGIIFGVSYIFFIWVFRVTSADQLMAIREMTGGLMKKFGQSRKDSNGSEDAG
jgi:O-antigen/teichoic acid export membrane protein